MDEGIEANGIRRERAAPRRTHDRPFRGCTKRARVIHPVMYVGRRRGEKEEEEERVEETKVRRKGGITPLCADELSPALIMRGTGREERRPPTWYPGRILQELHKAALGPPVYPACQPLYLPYKNDKTLFIKLPRRFSLGLAHLSLEPRKLNNPRTGTRSPRPIYVSE